MDEHLSREIRQRFVSYADDLACGADTLEGMFDVYKALVLCLAKAGMQVKASKVKFGVEEISFHNYSINSEHTRQKRWESASCQELHSTHERDRSESALGLHATDEPVLPTLWS